MLNILTQDHFLKEKRYVFEVLFGEILGYGFRLETTQTPDYQIVLPNGNSITIRDYFFKNLSPGENYSTKHLPEKAETVPHPFRENEKLSIIFGESIFYFRDNEIIAAFDVFASAFFMLTRWEEAVSYGHDRHERFPANTSLAAKFEFLNRPIVNEMANLLADLLEKLGWNAPRKKREFNLNLSHDVDYPLLWPSRISCAKTLISSLLSRNDFREFGFYLNWASSGKPDPNDTFDELMNISERAGTRSQFNFMGERPANSDAWYALNHPFVKNLMEKIARRGHQIGFHASYESFKNPEIFNRELQSLRQVSPVAISSGRQHFLRFSTPETWNFWNDAGLRFDSTLGYPEMEGFRCGICQPFPVFDFVARKKLELWEKPLVAMDVTLAFYQNYPPETALEKLNELREQVKKFGGEFTLLWHNSSWNSYFWARFREVYREFLKV